MEITFDIKTFIKSSKDADIGKATDIVKILVNAHGVLIIDDRNLAMKVIYEKVNKVGSVFVSFRMLKNAVLMISRENENKTATLRIESDFLMIESTTPRSYMLQTEKSF